MNVELRLRFMKLLINLPLRIADKLLVMPKAEYPQTQLLQSTYKRMLSVYQLECKRGMFDMPDGNFERFLRVSTKVIARLAEDDRYYRAWLGLSFLVATEEFEQLRIVPKEVKAQILKQWLHDISFLDDCIIEQNMVDFKETVVAYDLVNLIRLQRSSPSLPGNG